MPVLPTPPNNNNNNKKKVSWGSLSKTLSFWILIILIPVVFMEFSSARNDPAPPIIYSQYDHELQTDNIKSVTIQAGRQIVGEFKNKIELGGHEVQKFTVKLPVENSDEEVDRLRAHNVQIEAKGENPGISMYVM